MTITQKRNRVLKLLRTMLRNLRKLKEDEFYYARIVKDFEKENCGTCGCLIGYFPVWFPESGFFYGVYRTTDEWTVLVKDGEMETGVSLKHLISFLGIGRRACLAIYWTIRQNCKRALQW